MKSHLVKLCAGAALAASLSFAALGCDDTTNVNPPAPDFAMQAHPDMTVPPGGDMAGSDLTLVNPVPDMGCYPNPMTHIEIINACTSAKQLDKATNPNLPFLDGGALPPLP